MPSCPSTVYSWGNTSIISRSDGMLNARAWSMTRCLSLSEISRLRRDTATMPRLLYPLIFAPAMPMCAAFIDRPVIVSASSTDCEIDDAVASRFTTAPFRSPRDSAVPMPIISRNPSSLTSDTTVHTLAVPTSIPTMYEESCLAMPISPSTLLRIACYGLIPLRRRRKAERKFPVQRIDIIDTRRIRDQRININCGDTQRGKSAPIAPFGCLDNIQGDFQIAVIILISDVDKHSTVFQLKIYNGRIDVCEIDLFHCMRVRCQFLLNLL